MLMSPSTKPHPTPPNLFLLYQRQTLLKIQQSCIENHLLTTSHYSRIYYIFFLLATRMRIFIQTDLKCLTSVMIQFVCLYCSSFSNPLVHLLSVLFTQVCLCMRWCPYWLLSISECSYLTAARGGETQKVPRFMSVCR